MTNKHEIQKDFYQKQKEWKESLRTEKGKGQKLVLKEACYNGIKGIEKEIKQTDEHRRLVKTANLEIERHRQEMYGDTGDRELYR